MYNVGQGKGLTFWAPDINIFRDPRWGRGQETPGEDPLLTATYGVSYVRGLQGYTFDGQKSSEHLQASAFCKHFTAHDLDNWHGITRYMFDAKVTKQDMVDTFQPPFESCVKQGVAREQWHFDGYIVSHCNTVPIIYQQQGYAKTPEDAVAAVLNAGMDAECGSYAPHYSKAALDPKKITEEEINRALDNLFSVRMRLGLFDGDPFKDGSFGKFGPGHVCSVEHQNLGLEVARNSIVLLKNPENLLPLPKNSTYSLAVIGPNANSPEVLLECSSVKIEEVADIVKEVAYVILVMGLDRTQEREKLDQEDLVLPGEQQRLIASVAEVSKRPVVLVLLCGGPVDISLARDSEKIGSILWGGYPGEAGGLALADVIFGYHNPGGRLPITWYRQDFVQVPMTDVRMRPNKSSGYPGRTYRFYQGKKVFEFGYGLSYCTYSYEFASVSRNKLSLKGTSYTNRLHNNSNATQNVMFSSLGAQIREKVKFSVNVRVKNSGAMVGQHPVLLPAGS